MVWEEPWSSYHVTTFEGVRRQDPGTLFVEWRFLTGARIALHANTGNIDSLHRRDAFNTAVLVASFQANSTTLVRHKAEEAEADDGPQIWCNLRLCLCDLCSTDRWTCFVPRNTRFELSVLRSSMKLRRIFYCFRSSTSFPHCIFFFSSIFIERTPSQSLPSNFLVLGAACHIRSTAADLLSNLSGRSTFFRLSQFMSSIYSWRQRCYFSYLHPLSLNLLANWKYFFVSHSKM